MFNQGIFVKRLSEEYFNDRVCLFINSKKNLFDLHISRENITINERWHLFQNYIYNLIFDEIENQSDDSNTYVKTLSSLLYPNTSEFFPDDYDIFTHPFHKCFIERAPFPVLIDNRIDYLSIKEILANKINHFYDCVNNDFREEIKIVMEYSDGNTIVINPYSLPNVIIDLHSHRSIKIVDYLFGKNGMVINRIDIRTIILSKVVINDKQDYSYKPCNVTFAQFGDLKPIIVVNEFPCVREKDVHIGSAYWGNQLLFWRLIDEDRREKYSNIINCRYNILDSIELIKEQQVYIDCTDAFIAQILKPDNEVTQYQGNILRRYLVYLSYLPYVISELSSCQFFLEVIDKLESEIALSFNVTRPECLLGRLKPDSYLYIDYYDNREMNCYILK